MKQYFSKENRIIATLSPRGKRNYLILNLFSIALFILGAFAFFDVLYLLCNMFGSIVSGTPKAALNELRRVLPNVINDFAITYLGALAHHWTKPKSEEKLQQSFKKNAIITIVIGSILVLYVLMGIMTGIYHSLIESYPNALYPLDLVLYGLCYLAFGICLLIFRKKLDFELPYEEYHSHWWLSFLSFIQYIGTEFAFAAFIYSFSIVDWSHGHLFYSLMLELIFILMLAMIAIYKFVYCPLKQEEKRKFQEKTSLIFLILNTIVFILYLVSFSLDVAAPSDAWYGLLPIDFTASLNTVTYLYGLMLIITPLISFLLTKLHQKTN